MTPKQKAFELFNKYADEINFDDTYRGYKHESKKCALISVDEIINCDMFFKTLEGSKEFTKYWYEVQQEIQKL